MSTTTEERGPRLRHEGYLVVESLVSDDVVSGLRQRTADIADGRVPYPAESIELEPEATGMSLASVRKLNHCAASDPVFAAHAAHPGILDVVELAIGPDIRLFSSQLFMKPPGGIEKTYHQDLAYFPIEPLDLVTCWTALDDVTLENGCMWVIPGSHLWGDETPDPYSADFVKVSMSAGSVVVFAGTLWHRGGANHSDANRLGITPQYCEPWARQLENMILAVGPKARDYSDRIKSMLGYSITPPFMGYVDGRHPMKCLDDDFDPASTGDGARSEVFWDGEYRFRAVDATEGV